MEFFVRYVVPFDVVAAVVDERLPFESIDPSTGWRMGSASPGIEVCSFAYSVLRFVLAIATRGDAVVDDADAHSMQTYGSNG